MWPEIWRKLDSFLFGSAITLRWANKLVRRKLEECEVSQFSDDKRLKHSIHDLYGMLNLSVERLQRVENKAMGTLLGIAVAITIFGAASGLLGDGGMLGGMPQPIQYVAAAGLVVAMLYLFGSGLLALGAYKIGSVYGPTLSDRSPVAEECKEKEVILYSIEQNQRAAQLRSNELSAAFACLRNGLLVVVLLGLFTVFVGVYADDQSEFSTADSPQAGFSSIPQDSAY